MPISEFADQLLIVATESIRFIWMPLGIWTVLAGLFLLCMRYTPDSSPLLKYQSGTALLWSLPVGILLAIILPLSIAAPDSLLFAVDTPGAFSPQTLLAGRGAPASGEAAWHVYHFIGLLTALLMGMGLWNLAGVTGEAFKILRTGKSLGGLSLSDLAPDVDRLRANWRIEKTVQVVFSHDDHAPMTFGWRRPIIVLPLKLKHQADALHMTLVHELSHIRHRDYLRRLGEQIIRSFFFFHPFVSLLARRLDQYREMACDNEVLQQRGISARRYASLLLEFSQPRPVRAHLLAISMADSKTNLKHRIKAMKDYRFFSPGALNSTTIGLALAGFLLAVSAMMVACEVKFVEDNSVTIIEAPKDQESVSNMPNVAPRTSIPPAQSDGEIFMIVEDMPELIGGLASIQNQIKYPDIARKAGIEGRVFIQFVVDENGNVQDAIVVRGIGGGCDEEALRALNMARFRPGMQGGKPVKVKMSIPVTFKLDSESTPAARRAEIMRRLEILVKSLPALEEQVNKLTAEGQTEAATKLNNKVETISKEIEQLKARLEAES